MPKKCRSPQTDFQQCESYAWEDSLTLWAGSSESKKHMLKLIVRSAKLYKIPIPGVRFFKSDHKRGQKYASSFYDPGTHTINLRPRHMRPNVALHEVAHAIVDWIMGPHSRAGHGKAWLGVYVELLTKFEFFPREVIEFSIKRAGLKFSKRVHWSNIRKNHPKQVRDARRLRRLLSVYTKNKGPAT